MLEGPVPTAHSQKMGWQQNGSWVPPKRGPRNRLESSRGPCTHTSTRLGWAAAVPGSSPAHRGTSSLTGRPVRESSAHSSRWCPGHEPSSNTHPNEAGLLRAECGPGGAGRPRTRQGLRARARQRRREGPSGAARPTSTARSGRGTSLPDSFGVPPPQEAAHRGRASQNDLRKFPNRLLSQCV